MKGISNVMLIVFHYLSACLSLHHYTAVLFHLIIYFLFNTFVEPSEFVNRKFIRITCGIIVFLTIAVFIITSSLHAVSVILMHQAAQCAMVVKSGVRVHEPISE